MLDPNMLTVLFAAIEMVESSGGVNIVGDGGEAIGPLQIHKIYVDDVNRILGYDAFTYDDRYDRGKSRRMFCVYVSHYATEKRLGRKPTCEDLYRTHHGGPNGWKKKCTEPKWLEVKAELERKAVTND